MARWRRVCIDLDDSDCPIGGSIEYYSDSRMDAEAVLVLAQGEWLGRSSREMLDHLVDLGWSQMSLPLDWP